MKHDQILQNILLESKFDCELHRIEVFYFCRILVDSMLIYELYLLSF